MDRNGFVHLTAPLCGRDAHVSRRWIGVFAFLLAVLGCSETPNASTARRDLGTAGDGAGAAGAGVAGSPTGSEATESDEFDVIFNPGPVAPGAAAGLAVEPPAPVLLVVSGEAPATVAFQAKHGGSVVDARWAVDRGELGSIDDSGVFTASGKLGGTVLVTASFAEVTATTTVTINLQLTEHGDPAAAEPVVIGPGGYAGVGGDGPGRVPTAAQLTALSTAPSVGTDVVLLYPYDKTVFPQGLLAPLLQWDPAGHAFDAVSLHAEGPHLDYRGTFAANHTPFVNLPIPQATWETLTRTASGAELALTLTFAEGANAVGPLTVKWVIAPAVLHGTIYYNSYGTSFVKNSSDLDAYGEQYGAGTLGIAPGATAPRLAAGIDGTLEGKGCRVCHTVSGDGSLLVTEGVRPDPDASDTVFIDLNADTTAGAGTSLRGVPKLTFPALSKDGTLLLSNAGGHHGGDKTALYAMPGATPVPDVTGLPADFQATLPSLSPDGRHASFNHWGGGFAGTPLAVADRRSLAVLDFDGVSAFSNPRLLFTPLGSSPDVAVTFSSFLPDSSGVVFALQLGNTSQFWGYTWGENIGELWWADLRTGTAHRLDALNGVDPSGQPYLPDNARGAATHTAAQDVVLNYEPTVSPVAAGGYAWVVFTTRRMYGNVAQELQPWESDPRRYRWRDHVTSKKIWVAAIDLGAEPGTDPSHPAFYLPAQELYAGNSRGFWSLDPCREDGQTCETGVQCCGGYCTEGDGALTCGSDQRECAALYDRCDLDADCCDAPRKAACINAVCTAPEPTVIR